MTLKKINSIESYRYKLMHHKLLDFLLANNEIFYLKTSESSDFT